MPKTPEKENQGPDNLPDFKKILVAVDGSKNAERATEIAAGLAKKFDSELIVLHVVLGPPYSYSAMFPNADSTTPRRLRPVHGPRERAGEGVRGQSGVTR